jgi:hypothetical protein
LQLNKDLVADYEDTETLLSISALLANKNSSSVASWACKPVVLATSDDYCLDRGHEERSAKQHRD